MLDREAADDHVADTPSVFSSDGEHPRDGCVRESPAKGRSAMNDEDDDGDAMLMPTSTRVLGDGIGVHIGARGRARSWPKTRGVRRYVARGRFSERDGCKNRSNRARLGQRPVLHRHPVPMGASPPLTGSDSSEDAARGGRGVGVNAPGPTPTPSPSPSPPPPPPPYHSHHASLAPIATSPSLPVAMDAPQSLPGSESSEDAAEAGGGWRGHPRPAPAPAPIPAAAAATAAVPRPTLSRPDARTSTPSGYRRSIPSVGRRPPRLVRMMLCRGGADGACEGAPGSAPLGDSEGEKLGDRALARSGAARYARLHRCPRVRVVCVLVGLSRDEHANIASPAPPLGSLPRSTTEGSTSSRTSPCRRAWYRDVGRDVGFAIVATAGTPEHALEGAGHL